MEVPLFLCRFHSMGVKSKKKNPRNFSDGGKTLKEVSGFVSDKLSTLETVLSTATHFILKKYKDHGTVLQKKSPDQREKITP